MLSAKKVKAANLKRVKQLLEQDFPKEERLPSWLLYLLSLCKTVGFYLFYNENAFIGFTYLIYSAEMTFVFYLDVDAKKRSQGYGAEILSWIKAVSKTAPVVLNIEQVDPKVPNYEQRKKRKAFYLRNGFAETGSFENYQDAPYEILSTAPEFSKEAYVRLFRQYSFGVYTSRFSSKK